MNPLFALVPSATARWLILVVGAIVFGSLCFYKGASFEQSQQAKRDLAAERAFSQRKEVRAAITTRVETKYLPAIEKIRTVTVESIKYVDRFVPATAPDLPGGFRVQHDADAQGLVPDPARIADAAAVPAQDAARTVAENYGICLATAKQLEGLQEWVREQQQLKGGSP